MFMRRHNSHRETASNPAVQETERDALVQHLNEDLAGELQAVGMYLQYAAMLRGPNRKQLRDLFQAEIPDELRHAQFLADKIAVLGGTPTTQPREVPQALAAHEMLSNILAAEKRAIADYSDRVS